METVGKVYMVVGGAPTRNDTHVKDVCMGIHSFIIIQSFPKLYLKELIIFLKFRLVALEFRDVINELSVNSATPVHIRIGLQHINLNRSISAQNVCNIWRCSLRIHSCWSFGQKTATVLFFWWHRQHCSSDANYQFGTKIIINDFFYWKWLKNLSLLFFGKCCASREKFTFLGHLITFCNVLLDSSVKCEEL